MGKHMSMILTCILDIPMSSNSCIFTPLLRTVRPLNERSGCPRSYSVSFFSPCSSRCINSQLHTPGSPLEIHILPNIARTWAPHFPRSNSSHVPELVHMGSPS